MSTETVNRLVLANASARASLVGLFRRSILGTTDANATG
jgi:hypothetical protein